MLKEFEYKLFPTDVDNYTSVIPLYNLYPLPFENNLIQNADTGTLSVPIELDITASVSPQVSHLILDDSVDNLAVEQMAAEIGVLDAVSLVIDGVGIADSIAEKISPSSETGLFSYIDRTNKVRGILEGMGEGGIFIDYLYDSANNAGVSFPDFAESAIKLKDNAGGFSSIGKAADFASLIYQLADRFSFNAEYAVTKLAVAMHDGLVTPEELNEIFGDTPAALKTIRDWVDNAEGDKTFDTTQFIDILTKLPQESLNDISTPVTTGDSWESLKNTIAQNLLPVIDMFGKFVELLNDNWDSIELIFKCIGQLQDLCISVVFLTKDIKSLFELFCNLIVNYVTLAVSVFVRAVVEWVNNLIGRINRLFSLNIKTIVVDYDSLRTKVSSFASKFIKNIFQTESPVASGFEIYGNSALSKLKEKNQDSISNGSAEAIADTADIGNILSSVSNNSYTHDDSKKSVNITVNSNPQIYEKTDTDAYLKKLVNELTVSASAYGLG